MDRQIIFPGQIPLETDLLNTNKNVMLALGYLAQDILGLGVIASGFTCIPTSPASLSVQVTPGRLYTLFNVDNTAYSSLAADTAHQVLKQGILFNAINLACPAPTTGGTSINYLIEAQYQDVDANSVLLPYYNAANPASAYSGPNNSGVSQNTVRQGVVNFVAKAGTAAATGTQVTPAADAGYTGLFVVTVAAGASTIVGGNISTLSGAPFLPQTLPGLGAGGGGISQTAAELAAGVTPAATVYDPGDLRRYGASTASADNTAPVQQAINASGFGQLWIVPPGSWNIASSAGTSSLTMVSNSSCRGAGGAISKLVVTGSNPGHLLYGKNLSNVRFDGVGLVGNNAATINNYGLGGALYFDSDNTAAAQMGGYEIQNCRFDNFRGPYWISFWCNSSSFDMRHINVKNNLFISFAGNASRLNVAGYPAGYDAASQIVFASDCIAMQGSTIAQLYVNDVEVSGNCVEGNFIKRFCTVWGGVLRANIHDNFAKNLGTDASLQPPAWNSSLAYVAQNNVSLGGINYRCILANTNQTPPNATYWQVWDGMGAYAFMAYRQAGVYGNDRINYHDNVVDQVYDNGFYCAGCIAVNVRQNEIRGQVSSANNSIPKGAISCDGTQFMSITDNKIDSCRLGISWIGLPPTGQGLIDSNQITNLPTSAPGILIATVGANAWNSATFYAPGSLITSGGSLYFCILANTNQVPPNATYWSLVATNQWYECKVTNNTINGFANSGALGIDHITTPTAGGKVLKVSGNTFDCFRYGYFLDQGASGDALMDVIDLSGNNCKTGNSGGFYLGTTIRPSVSCRSNQFSQGGAFNNSIQHITAPLPVNLDISDNEFANFTSGTGACIYAANPAARFRMWNNRFMNVDNTHLGDASAVNNPGYTQPNWSGNQTDLVQFFQQNELGSGGSKYMLIGWGWDQTNAAWKAIRTLTGN